MLPPTLPDTLISSLTSHSLSRSMRKRGEVSREGDRHLPGVSHPYHAYNSAYNPVSRQDSELQSLSSDAHTTEDNLSGFTESLSHYSYR